MKNLITPLLMATALIATACTNTNDIDTPDVDPSGKTPISFSVEENHNPRTRAGFTADTKIAMRIKSTDGNSTVYTRAVATAKQEKDNSGYSEIDLTDKRYWDDAFGRKASLSVYAIAVPGFNDTNSTTFEEKLTAGSTTWFTESPEKETLSWSVTTSAQTKDLIDAEDLTYSNNIQNGGKKGVYKYDFANDKYPVYSSSLADGCMVFTQQSGVAADGPGKFDKGHLVFNHALSRITVTLTKGAGFGSDAFNFESGKNVTIKNVPVSGTLDLSTGTWTTTTTDIKDIEKMYQSASEAHSSYTLMAQMLPDYVISDGSTINMLTFKIDDNQYYITQDQMFDALKAAADADTKTKAKMSKLEDDKVTMEQGLNYVFNIKVNKTGVLLTANVVDFIKVTADEIDAQNDHVSFNLTSTTGDPSTNFDLYRSVITSDYDKKNWGGNYEKHSTALTSKGGNAWSTDWFFDSNLTYYHFRMVNKGTTVVSKDGETDVDDYFTISAGSTSSTDIHWGAPMTTPPVYDVTNGYAGNISLAIGPTSERISMFDMHVMSNIIVKLKTTNGNDKVDLAGSTVTISNLYGTGKVLMGNGLVTPTGVTATTQHNMDYITADDQFTYAVVPQVLARGTGDDDYICITIETGDHNKYSIIKKLSTITAETVADAKNQTQGAAITRWYPGHTYSYTFTLKKTGITDITCNVLGWVDVEATEKTISLED